MARTPQSTAPRRYSPLIVLGLLVASGVVLLVLVLALRDAVDPLRRAEAWAAHERQQQIDEQLSTLDTLVAAGWRLLPLVLVACAGGVGVVALYHRLAARRFVEADKLIAMTRAQQQRFPNGLQTLAFHDSSRQDRAMLPEPAYGEEEGEEGEEGESAPAAVPTFAQLLDTGKVGKGNPLILGYERATGEELAGSWLDLYATATAGLPGTGKTTSQRYYACQTALHGARFIVCDPHMGAADDSLAATLDPLRGLYLCEPASEPRTILKAVQYAADIATRRLNGKDDSRTPNILWLDELTSLLGRSDVGDELATLLEFIAQEGRKKYVYLSASGQIWTASRTTSELRDSFASVLCHRMKRSQARLLLPTEEAATVERLAQGEAVLWRTSGETTTVKIPNTTAADVQRVASMLASAAQPPRALSATAEALRRRDGGDLDAPADATNSASGRGADLGPNAARVLALFRGGMDVPGIVREVYAIESTSNRQYRVARAEVEAILRAALGGGA